MTGNASRTDGFAGENGRPQASAAIGTSPELGSTQRPGPARPGPAGRRVAVIVDGSTGSVPALRQAASQARQRNATLDVIHFLPAEADARTVTQARVQLGEFSRRACPYGVGVPVRLLVELGDLDAVLPTIQADAELLVTVPGPAAGAAEAVPGPATNRQAAGPQAPARKAPARKAPARKAPARKAPARKAPARKAPAPSRLTGQQPTGCPPPRT